MFRRKCTIRNKIHKKESKLLKQNNKEEKEILPFVTQYQPSVSTIKEAWMKKWNLNKTNYNFNKFLKNHQSFPYNKGKSLKEMLARAPPKKVNRGFHACIDVRPAPLCIFSHNRFVSILALNPAGSVLYNKCSQLSR